MTLNVQTKRDLKGKDGDSIYITNIDLNNDVQSPLLAAVHSSTTIEIMRMESLKSISTLNLKSSLPVTAVRFSKNNPNNLYCSTEEGNIILWDLRENNGVVSRTYKDPEVSKVKPINCFDISLDERFLVAGTDLVGSEAYLLFWDCRTSKILGGYWECHTDDILNVEYHPSKNNILMSSGTDGLINIMDLTQCNEDEALLKTLNSEKTIAKSKWLIGDHLLCITHNEDVQLWDHQEIEKLSSFDRENASKNHGIPVDYFIDIVHPTNSSSNEVLGLLASGNNDGVLQLWNVSSLGKDKISIDPWKSLKGGHKDVVRCIHGRDNIFVTGGEDGIICIWKNNVVTDTSLKNMSVLRKHFVHHNKNPY